MKNYRKLINNIREAVQQEHLLAQDMIEEEDITVEFEHKDYIEEDIGKIIIDKDKLYAELIYENMTYQDDPACNKIYEDITRSYLRDGLLEWLEEELLDDFIDKILTYSEMEVIE